ncbi:TetR/AcrR family transcriptional regulator [Burkholderia stagnalis]|uniref:TetR/AcrR family transcriptional regulator n=1 Tax=Burkholderia stagnalis TaxID=1503054 RepID=UPI0007560957|nr:TetR/AcrR family transcriptional regulator [Burkholderia stagnalis]KVC59295.1 TetR family transcriptional regulator [Burkholderia stagnalis]KVN22574.1 TetR family transcriptional regulator [Burkholderia stagnalis]KWI76646.1 TetR family transcriptional regulator [Burkholderia stagnalis]KWK65387.1 TetR family transcriptional regulator [Burkholderia stagnalis]KWN21382.1 TetR family transcriptional regulator [Burkholderia stagnalis]
MSDIETAKPVSRRTRQPISGAAAQEHLLRAAEELFYREGVRAVGVEAVVELAGVNKMSLYRQFSSKDELILAYLERMDACFFERFDTSVAKHPGQPKAQLIQYFTDLAERATQKDYRGCPFVNVAAEFPDASHPARERVAQNKERLMARLVELCASAGARQPAFLADSLALVIEGIYAASQTYRYGETPIGAAPALATQLIEAACA